MVGPGEEAGVGEGGEVLAAVAGDVVQCLGGQEVLLAPGSCVSVARAFADVGPAFVGSQVAEQVALVGSKARSGSFRFVSLGLGRDEGTLDGEDRGDCEAGFQAAEGGSIDHKLTAP